MTMKEMGEIIVILCILALVSLGTWVYFKY